MSFLLRTIIYIYMLLSIVTVVTGGQVYILDLAAKLDQCADFVCKQLWGEVDFPPPFGREAYPEVCSSCFIYLTANGNNNIVIQFNTI